MTSPPDPTDDVVPYSAREVLQRLTAVRDHLETQPDVDASPVSTLNLALTLIKHMACPHPDCLHLAVEHEPRHHNA